MVTIIIIIIIISSSSSSSSSSCNNIAGSRKTKVYRGSTPAKVKFFLLSQLSRLAQRSKKLLNLWKVGVFTPKAERLRREYHHPLPSGAEVKKEWIYQSNGGNKDIYRVRPTLHIIIFIIIIGSKFPPKVAVVYLLVITIPPPKQNWKLFLNIFYLWRKSWHYKPQYSISCS